MSEEKFSDPQTRDLNNAAFWEKLSETLQETMLMLTEMAEEKGIDLNSIEIDAEAAQHRAAKENSVIHMSSHMAKSYADLADEWFDVNIAPYHTADNELPALSDRDLIHSEPQNAPVSIIDAMEVIRWYQHQIYVKLKRAVESTQSEKEEPDLWDDFPRDSQIAGERCQCQCKRLSWSNSTHAGVKIQQRRYCKNIT